MLAHKLSFVKLLARVMAMNHATLLPVAAIPPAAEDAMERLRRMARARHNATKDERAVIVEALQKGARQADVARAIDRSREHVAQVWRRRDEYTGHDAPTPDA